MKSACPKWKEPLLEAALSGTLSRDLEQHIGRCPECKQELAALAARREQLEALLPLVAQGAEPSPDFRERVLAAAKTGRKAKPAWQWRMWGLAAATAVAAAVMFAFAWHSRTQRNRQASELAAAEKLADWRAPSDVLLQTPGREILRTTPRLGESYLAVPLKAGEKKNRGE